MKDIKKKLESIQWLDKEIRALQLERQYITETLFQKSTLTDVPRTKTTANTTEAKTIKAIKMSETIQGKIDKLVTERETIISLIDSVEGPKERTILRLFYVNQLDPMDIADKLDLSKTSIYSYRKTALELLADSQK